MNILLLGSGGRECTIAWKLAQSKKCNRLFIAPGNAGTSNYGTNVAIGVNDFDQLSAFVIENKIELLVVGPEDPLVNGIRNYFEAIPGLQTVKIIGPDRTGAQLEGSKDYSKKFMQRFHIPTAAYGSFNRNNIEAGFNFLESLNAPYVLKADGLAAGKGVLIIDSLEEAKTELQAMLFDSKFGTAGETVVIEEFLNGIELSVFVLTDGTNYVVLPEAKDYKRIGEGDTGLNTGGMGAVSPVPFAGKEFMQKVEKQIIAPTIAGLQSDGINYKGFIFIGLMSVNDEPYVIEYNVRLGDPETEVVIPRLKNDLVELMEATADGTLNKIKIDTDNRTALTVILASGGYPGPIEKGKEISELEQVAGSLIFHAGTSMKENKIVTSGGRVLAVTTLAESLSEAQEVSMKNARTISFDKKYFRTDIGSDLLTYV